MFSKKKQRATILNPEDFRFQENHISYGYREVPKKIPKASSLNSTEKNIRKSQKSNFLNVLVINPLFIFTK